MITVRPSRAGFRSILGSGIGIAVASLVSGLFRGHVGIELVAPPALALTITTLLAFAFRINARVERSGDTLTVRSLIGTTRTLPTDDVARFVDARRVNAGSGPTGRIALLNSDGFALLRLTSTYWEESQLRLLSQSFEERRDVLREPIGMRELIAQYPHALNFRTQHPFIALGVTLGLIVVAAASYVWLVESA